MEIPYEVTARRDTGLYNAKIGVWLFLASEVMLFGGLSGYSIESAASEFATLMREELSGESGISEKKMFGGLCFLKDGNMICGVHAGGGMARVGKAAEAEALKINGITPLSFTGRKMGGMVDVSEDVLGDDDRRGVEDVAEDRDHATEASHVAVPGHGVDFARILGGEILPLLVGDNAKIDHLVAFVGGVVQYIVDRLYPDDLRGRGDQRNLAQVLAYPGQFLVHLINLIQRIHFA